MTTNASSSFEGTLFIISAPSGAGKTSLTNQAVLTLPNLVFSISYTTRPARPGEQDGVHYHFIDEQRFEQMIGADLFLEHARVFGNGYGTAKENIMTTLEQGYDVILDIDWQGAQEVRHHMPQAVSIFIMPPSLEILKQRLQKRKQDAPHIIEKRMDAALKEMDHYQDYDYLLVNEEFNVAVNQLVSIITSQRLRCNAQQHRHAALLSQLLYRAEIRTTE